MVAILNEPECHEPPAVASESDVVAPAQTAVAPAINAGSGFTVMVTVLIQPVFKVYVTVVVPAETPVTTPVAEPIFAIPGEPELQLPPDVASLKFILRPAQTFERPIIAAGRGFTVTVLTVIQPVGNVYVTIPTPAATPITIPVDEPTLAIPGVLPLQTPPDNESDKLVVSPKQTVLTPLTAEGNGLTVIAIAATQPVGNI